MTLSKRAAQSLMALMMMTTALSAVADMSVGGTPATRVQIGQTYYFKPVVQNGIMANLQFGYVNKPAWSKSYRGSGVICGTPTQAGVWDNIQVMATDGVHYAWSKPFTIVVESAVSTTRVTIAGNPPTLVQVGKSYSFTPTVIATPNSKWTYSVRNKPAWAQFSSSSGTLSGMPLKAAPASYEDIVISVSNGTSTAALPAFDIDVVQPTSGTAKLTWATPPRQPADPAARLRGYVIRYGTSASAMTRNLSVANSTTAEIQNLSAGMWYFKVAAVTAENIVGEFSAIAGDLIQ